MSTKEQQIAELEKDWAENPRWKGIKRGYSAADVVRLRGSFPIEYTLARRGAEKLWDLVNSGATPTPADIEVLGTEGTGPIDLFLAGRLAMATLNQGHMLNAIGANANFGIVPEPMVTGNDRFVNAWSLTASVWKGTEHPQEAWEFLKYWVGPEGQQFLMENGNLFPSIRSVLDQYKDADKPYVQAFFGALEDKQVAVWVNAHACNSTVLRAATDAWDLINLGQIERDQIQATLDSLVPAAQTALDECRTRLGN